MLKPVMPFKMEVGDKVFQSNLGYIGELADMHRNGDNLYLVFQDRTINVAGDERGWFVHDAFVGQDNNIQLKEKLPYNPAKSGITESTPIPKQSSPVEPTKQIVNTTVPKKQFPSAVPSSATHLQKIHTMFETPEEQGHINFNNRLNEHLNKIGAVEGSHVLIKTEHPETGETLYHGGILKKVSREARVLSNPSEPFHKELNPYKQVKTGETYFKVHDTGMPLKYNEDIHPKKSLGRHIGEGVYVKVTKPGETTGEIDKKIKSSVSSPISHTDIFTQRHSEIKDRISDLTEEVKGREEKFKSGKIKSNIERYSKKTEALKSELSGNIKKHENFENYFKGKGFGETSVKNRTEEFSRSSESDIVKQQTGGEETFRKKSTSPGNKSIGDIKKEYIPMQTGVDKSRDKFQSSLSKTGSGFPHPGESKESSLDIGKHSNIVFGGKNQVEFHVVDTTTKKHVKSFEGDVEDIPHFTEEVKKYDQSKHGVISTIKGNLFTGKRQPKIETEYDINIRGKNKPEMLQKGRNVVGTGDPMKSNRLHLSLKHEGINFLSPEQSKEYKDINVEAPTAAINRESIVNQGENLKRYGKNLSVEHIKDSMIRSGVTNVTPKAKVTAEVIKNTSDTSKIANILNMGAAGKFSNLGNAPKSLTEEMKKRQAERQHEVFNQKEAPIEIQKVKKEKLD